MASYVYESSSASFFNSKVQSLSKVVHTNKENGEIDIFSADKYFSGRMDEDDARKANMIARRIIHQDKKAELQMCTQPQTPSVYSESSCNSQSALLRRPRNPPGTKAKAPKKNFFANLRCNCACSDKNSVEIDEYPEEHNQNVEVIKNSLDQTDLIRMKRLQLQNMSGKEYALSSVHSSSPANTLVVKKVQSLEEQEEERKSLEVFGASHDKGSRSFSLERRLNTLAWDAIPKVEENIEIQGPISSESIKDTESEASSDLFEIECLSCSANPVVLPRNTLDSSCLSPNCYAPSEVSVEWSVVTASAADFSLVSDSEEQAPTTYRKMLPPRPKKPTTSIIELPKPKPRYGGLLSGCNTQKAVRVAEDVYNTTSVRSKLDTSRMMKFQMDTTKNVEFGSKYRKDMLYIQ